jgi:16S rRNA (uracil1498-N3)-methyltransferase
MTQHRFFVQPNQISEGQVTICGPQARQICAVLRLHEGDRIGVLDGSGCCHIARIGSAKKDQVVAEITETIDLETESCIRLTLAQALTKHDKVELVVQKATELGISEVMVFTSERTVPRPAGDKIAHRLDRWRSIAREAAEQSNRASMPVVDGIMSFGDLLRKSSEFDCSLIAWEDETKLLLHEALVKVQPGSRVLYTVGPEGGFSQGEVAQAVSAGVIPVSLGATTLRAETAAIAGCAVILHLMETRGNLG